MTQASALAPLATLATAEPPKGKPGRPRLCLLCRSVNPTVDDAVAIGLPPSLIASNYGFAYHEVIEHRKHLTAAGRACAPSARRYNTQGNRGNVRPLDSLFNGSMRAPASGTKTIEVTVAAAAQVEERLRLLGASATLALLLGVATLEKEHGALAVRERQRASEGERVRKIYPTEHMLKISEIREGEEQ